MSYGALTTTAPAGKFSIDQANYVYILCPCPTGWSLPASLTEEFLHLFHKKTKEVLHYGGDS